jgi:hypothetical protein
MHTMPTIADAASETRNRLDMTDPFLKAGETNKPKESQASRLCKNDRSGRFVVGLIFAFVLKERSRLSWLSARWCAGIEMLRNRSDNLRWRERRATAHEDGHYCFAIPL